MIILYKKIPNSLKQESIESQNNWLSFQMKNISLPINIKEYKPKKYSAKPEHKAIDVLTSGFVYFTIRVKNRTETKIEYIENIKDLPDGIKVFRTRGECKSFINGERKRNTFKLK